MVKLTSAVMLVMSVVTIDLVLSVDIATTDMVVYTLLTESSSTTVCVK